MENDNLLEEYKSGKIVLINKPLNWTSFDAVNRIRWQLTRMLGVKKLKVGHAGTLDPLASGLLIICIGKATKIIESIQDLSKTYRARIVFGATTPSYDLETEIDQTFSVDNVNKENIEKAFEEFLGEYDQMPPIFSAKKVNGKPAYEYARKSQDVKLKSKKVFFHEIVLEHFYNNEAVVTVKCSKGTYVRSFAHDLGKKLYSGAYLKELERTQIGEFCVKDAWNLQEYIDYVKNRKQSN